MTGPRVPGGRTLLKALLAVVFLALAIALANMAGRRIGGELPPPSERDAAALRDGQ